jgi:hypothetical protein
MGQTDLDRASIGWYSHKSDPFHVL